MNDERVGEAVQRPAKYEVDVWIVSPAAMRRALADIERAEGNGFMFCEVVLRPEYPVGRSLHQRVLVYDGLSERAHPTDGNLNWGRGQNVTRDNEFRDGKLVRKKGPPK